MDVDNYFNEMNKIDNRKKSKAEAVNLNRTEYAKY
jgi:hypothetical protein